MLSMFHRAGMGVAAWSFMAFDALMGCRLRRPRTIMAPTGLAPVEPMILRLGDLQTSDPQFVVDISSCRHGDRGVEVMAFDPLMGCRLRRPRKTMASTGLAPVEPMILR